MDCRDIVQMLEAGGELTPAAREHVSSCSRCRALVEATRFSSQESGLPPEVLDKFGSIAARDLVAVRPLNPALYSLLFLGCALCAALVVILVHGSAGWRASTLMQRLWFIPGLLVMAAGIPVVLSRLMIPGSLLRVSPERLLLTGACWFGLAAPLVYAPRMYPAFGRNTLACLLIGLSAGGVVALAAWLIMRRGFVASPGTAAITAGALGGTSSLAAQFVYCPHLDSGHYALAHFDSFALLILFAGLLSIKKAAGRRAA